jgi:putative endonuclease
MPNPRLLNKSTATSLNRGIEAEQQAYHFLLQQGLQLIERNFRCRYGELDLVMRDQAIWVIVEVRYRQSEVFGGAVASINAKKRARIIAATQYYQMIHALDVAIRFDVIAINGGGNLQWISNAFQL